MYKKRTSLEVKQRLHHSSDSSLGIYSKPARLLKLVKNLDSDALRYASLVRDNFERFYRVGVFPLPP